MPGRSAGVMLDVRQNKFQSTLEILNDCIQACNSCLTDCLLEQEIAMLVDCIELDRDCADICSLTSQYLSRDSRFAPKLAEQCAVVCDACAKECEKHADHMEHCKQCALICRSCAAECRKIASMM
jgi:hypothetical protein